MNIIFDFDGTICDSTGIVLEMVNPALKKIGKRSLTIEEIREKGTLKILDEMEVNRTLIPFIVVYARLKIAPLIPKMKPFPHIKSTIITLSKSHTLGIVTSNSEPNVHQFLENNNLGAHFTFVYSSMNYFDKKNRITKALKEYNLDIEDSFFVGDETRDMFSAKSGGMKTIAVTWGMEGEKLLKKSKPNHIIGSPKELINIVK